MACGALAVLGVLAAAGRVPGATPEPPIMDASSGYEGTETLGTRGHDTIPGTRSDDLVFTFGGDDRIEAGAGDDLIDAGNGSDQVRAGDGDDRIRAFDHTKDTVWCGDGDDVVFGDLVDVLHDCEELVEADDFSSPTTPDPPTEGAPDATRGPAPLVRGVVDLKGEGFICQGPVDLELVRVKVGRSLSAVDAVSLGPYCSGRIKRIEIDTWSGDGIKVQNAGAAAHDLVIESGYVRCHAKTQGYHQDGIQVMGGKRLTFRRLAVFCGGDSVNAALFIARGGADDRLPTDIVFERGVLGPGSAQTAFVADSLRSGVRNTVICEGRFRSVRIQEGAVDAIERDNRVVGADHRACRGV